MPPSTRDSRWRTAAIASLSCALGLIDAPAPRAADAPAGIEATEAWIRWLPAGLPAGGYLVLRNRGSKTQVLTGAASPAYAAISMHRVIMDGGASQMQPVPRIELPPGATLSFATSGYHFMLEQAIKPLQPGDHVPVTLRFEGGSSLSVSFEVRRPDSGSPP